MKKHSGITNNILDLVGDTPLLRLNKITKELEKQNVLEKKDRGIYIKRKNIKLTWSYNQVKEIAYGDTWKSWFIKFD